MNDNSDTKYIKRCMDDRITAFIDQDLLNKNVLLVEGARQVGKTRMVEHALQQVDRLTIQLNFEKDRRIRSAIDACVDFVEFEQLLADRFGFDGSSGQVLFIDEAQESETLGRHVRFMKESWQHASVILSGSSLTRLFRADMRYPVGRVERLCLAPFNFCEFLSAKQQGHLADALTSPASSVSASRHKRLLELLDEFLLLGGLPALVLNTASFEGAPDMLARLMADYEEDFRRIFGEEAAHVAKDCLRSVANHLGSVSKNSSVIPAASGSQSARVREVFDRLEGWHLLIRSDQLSPSPEQSHNYLPKRYLFDTGIARYLREAAIPGIQMLHTLDADSRKPLGGVLENQVAIVLAQQFGHVQGWKRSPSGSEVDFVVKDGGRTIPIECKASLSIGKRHFRGIREYLSRYGLSLGVTVSLAPYEVFSLSQDQTIVNLPLYMMDFWREYLEA